MCIKCKKLKKIWWSKQQPLIHSPKELVPNTYHVLMYEAQSSWKALMMQENKHINKVFKCR